jgi:hypothetical protein
MSKKIYKTNFNSSHNSSYFHVAKIKTNTITDTLFDKLWF